MLPHQLLLPALQAAVGEPPRLSEVVAQLAATAPRLWNSPRRRPSQSTLAAETARKIMGVLG